MYMCMDVCIDVSQWVYGLIVIYVNVYDGSGVWCPTDVKSVGFWSQLEAQLGTSHTKMF